MKKPISCAFLVLGLLACSSASSGRGDIAPGQLDPNGPGAPEPPMTSPSPPPANSGFGTNDAPPGCPEKRIDEETVTDLTDVAEVRARLVGIYRDCHGTFGTELRVDPNSETRLLLWSLDERFVRRTTPATTGWIDIQSCSGTSCTVEWHVDDTGADSSISELRMWSAPTAVHIETTMTNNQTSYFEWVHVAK